MRLADPALVARLPVKRLDGADTWRVLAAGEQAGTPFLPE
jgi:hypothetical protein